MTKNRDFKRRIRARMKKTGEAYTAARAQLLRKSGPKRHSAGISDARIQPKTGHTWAEWVQLLDAEGAAELPHRRIAEIVSRKYHVPDWWAQMVTVGYERIKGLRERGQRRDGTYEANKSRTFSVPVRTLYDAWLDDRTRLRWLDASSVVVRTASRPRTMRLGWSDGTIVAVGFTAKGRKSSVAVQHTRLKDRAAVEHWRRYWSEQLEKLARILA